MDLPSIPANFFFMQRREIFVNILWNHCAHIQKCLKNLPKIYEDNLNVLKVLQSCSELSLRISFAEHNLFFFQKSEKASVEKLLFNCAHFSIHYCFEYKMHVTYFIFSRRLSDMAATTHNLVRWEGLVLRRD